MLKVVATDAVLVMVIFLDPPLPSPDIAGLFRSVIGESVKGMAFLIGVPIKLTGTVLTLLLELALYAVLALHSRVHCAIPRCVTAECSLYLCSKVVAWHRTSQPIKRVSWHMEESVQRPLPRAIDAGAIVALEVRAA